MTDAVVNPPRQKGKDRRALPRMDEGRRGADRARETLIPEEAELNAPGEDSGARYLLLVALLVLIILTGIRAGNVMFAPLLNDPASISSAAQVLGAGNTYHTYDLNIETRQLREEHIGNLPVTPFAAVMGASHWQEGRMNVLAPGVDMYNAHVHRDYYEDLLGVVEMFVTHDRLPKNLLITLRDNQFTPVEARTDWLWTPILPYYRAMADRLGIESHNEYSNGLTPQLRQRLSVPLLKANLQRWMEAPVKPGPGTEWHHPTLDTLLPDGSIDWSDIHLEAFTQERSASEAMSFALAKRNSPPMIDQFGVQSVDAMFAYLAKQGVNVYLTHPPFNPIYWDAMRGTPYMEGLERIKELTHEFADRHGFKVIGGFDPYALGCTEEMYIDGEHSNAECLGKVVDLFLYEIMPVRP